MLCAASLLMLIKTINNLKANSYNNQLRHLSINWTKYFAFCIKIELIKGISPEKDLHLRKEFSKFNSKWNSIFIEYSS